MVVVTFDKGDKHVIFDCGEKLIISFELCEFQIEKVKEFISALEDIVFNEKPKNYDMLFMIEYESEESTFQVRIDDNQSNIFFFSYLFKGKNRTLGMMHGTVNTDNGELLDGLKNVLLPELIKNQKIAV